MSQDGVYWLFTSSAQTVAAFVAFLLAGFALALGMLDDAVERDDTLTDVVTELKRQYHARLRSLAEMTAAAIISDLLIVLVQGTGTAYHWSLLAIGCILNAAAIVLAVYFVVSLVDPDRIPKAARRLLAEEAAPTGDASLGEFVEVFIPLERQVRELAVAADLAVGRGPERFESFSRLVQLLLSRERLDRDLAASLLELGRYRNLVVHGHVQSVDRTMVQRAKAALGMMQALADSRRKAEAAQQGVEADEAR